MIQTPLTHPSTLWERCYHPPLTDGNTEVQGHQSQSVGPTSEVAETQAQ